jgi:hypothetical protein
MSVWCGDDVMKSMVALACAGWLNVPGAHPPNVAPLALGMTPWDVSQALGVPLAPVYSRGRSDVFYAVLPSGIPGFYRVDGRIYLQFRRGCLTGWTNDWRRPPRGLL